LIKELARSTALIAVAITLVAGCEKKDDKRPPEVARNTDHVSYATAYPDRVERVNTELDEQKARAV
jgi:hypothetical protein